MALKIAPGESVAIIGQNGADKTTLVKHLTGLLAPSAATVRVGAGDTRQRSVAQLAAVVGDVFQNPNGQLLQSTVAKEIEFGRRNLRWPVARVTASTPAALEHVELTGLAGRHPYDLSPSERKRVALAAVLAMETPIVVLDEPTSGQDDGGQQFIGRIVAGLKARRRTSIAVTHAIDFCAEHFERVIVMSEGQVWLDGQRREAMA